MIGARLHTNSLLVLGILLLLAGLSPCEAATADEHFRRALSLRFSGNVEAAIVEYRRGLALKPDLAQAHDQLGQLLLEEQGDVDGAISEFMTALRIDPSCSTCNLHLNDALDKKSSKSSDQVLRGNYLYSTGQFNRAAAAYRIAIHIDPSDPIAHNSLAWTLYKLGNLTEGVAEVERALQLKPNDPEYINTLACLLFDKGDVDGALATWKKAIALSKSASAADLYGLAVGLLFQGDSEGAARNFSEAIKIDPKYADASYVRDRIGMSVRAMAMHDRLISLTEKHK